jgi:thioredoxin-like negative regulator of GroEL
MISSLVFAFVMQASLAANASDNYADAYREHATNGKPLLVLVGADWCPGCRKMKDHVIPQARKQGVLRDVAFATVNTDHDRDLARKLMRGGSIPQLVLFHHTADGWKRTQLTGAQSTETLKSLVSNHTPDPSIRLSSN